MSLHPKKLARAVFSASNINAIAASLFSISLGALAGTIVFILAAIIGTLNKYQSLRGSKNRSTNIFLKRFADPSITAQILMLAAGINAVLTAWLLITSNEYFIYHLVLTCAWGFGCLGDDMLRRNDNTNFSDNFKIKKDRPLWIQALWVTIRDPLFYYITCNIFFTLAVLVSPEGAMTTLLIAMSVCVIFMSLFAVSYSFFKAFDIIKGKIETSQSHDYVCALCSAIINLTLMAMAALQGLEWVVAAQILFFLSNILIFFETQRALQTENL